MERFSVIFIAVLIFEHTIGSPVSLGLTLLPFEISKSNDLPFQNLLNKLQFSGSQARSFSANRGSFSTSSSGAISGFPGRSFSSSNAGSLTFNPLFSRSNGAFSESKASSSVGNAQSFRSLPQDAQDYRAYIDVRSGDGLNEQVKNDNSAFSISSSQSSSEGFTGSKSKSGSFISFGNSVFNPVGNVFSHSQSGSSSTALKKEHFGGIKEIGGNGAAGSFSESSAGLFLPHTGIFLAEHPDLRNENKVLSSSQAGFVPFSASKSASFGDRNENGGGFVISSGDASNIHSAEGFSINGARPGNDHHGSTAQSDSKSVTYQNENGGSFASSSSGASGIQKNGNNIFSSSGAGLFLFNGHNKGDFNNNGQNGGNFAASNSGSLDGPILGSQSESASFLPGNRKSFVSRNNGLPNSGDGVAFSSSNAGSLLFSDHNTGDFTNTNTQNGVNFAVSNQPELGIPQNANGGVSTVTSSGGTSSVSNSETGSSVTFPDRNMGGFGSKPQNAGSSVSFSNAVSNGPFIESHLEPINSSPGAGIGLQNNGNGIFGSSSQAGSAIFEQMEGLTTNNGQAAVSFASSNSGSLTGSPFTDDKSFLGTQSESATFQHRPEPQNDGIFVGSNLGSLVGINPESVIQNAGNHTNGVFSNSNSVSSSFNENTRQGALSTSTSALQFNKENSESFSAGSKSLAVAGSLPNNIFLNHGDGFAAFQERKFEAGENTKIAQKQNAGSFIVASPESIQNDNTPKDHGIDYQKNSQGELFNPQQFLNKGRTFSESQSHAFSGNIKI